MRVFIQDFGIISVVISNNNKENSHFLYERLVQLNRINKKYDESILTIIGYVIILFGT